MILVLLFFLLSDTNFVVARTNYDDRPRIYLDNGHLTFVASPYKNITFKTSKNSGVSINDVDLLTTLTKAHNASKLAADYEKLLSGYTDRIETLEDKLGVLQNIGETVPASNGSSAVSDIVVRRLNRRLNNLQRRVNLLRNLVMRDDCADNPCKNGGRCQDLVGKYQCQCLQGWEGQDCDVDVNECAIYAGTDLGCQNGAKCTNLPGTYECDCPAGFNGIHCTIRKTGCQTGSTELCGHGTCVNQHTASGFKCICDQGWKTDGVNPACTIDVDECASNHPSCSLNPKVQCINVPGSYYCGNCPAGFSGNGYHCHDIDECLTNNGGCSMNPLVTCINTHGSRVCSQCPLGYSGDGVTCTYQGVCNVNNGGCHPLARCTNNPSISSTYVECICPPGYLGTGIGPNGCVYSVAAANPCLTNPCHNGGSCSVQTNGGYICTCKGQYTGRNCDIIGRDPCRPNPCLNGGTCQNLAFMAYRCSCKRGFTGVICDMEQEACGGFIRGNEGTIKYPSTNSSSYGNRISCAFTIASNVTSKVLNITFTKFDLEESPGCSNDWLEIHDGRNTAAPTLGRFCGNRAPFNGTFMSTHDTLYLWFRSNAAIVKGGFELKWKAVPWACGGEFEKNFGSIQSPGAPHNYPLARDCWWRLATSPEKRFLFTFHTLNIGPNVDCSQDLIQFFTMLDLMRDNDRFKRICNSTVPEPFYSPGNTVLIHFHSNSKDAYPGFQMNYVAVEGIPGCGGVFSNKQGYIHSPLTPKNVICEYIISQPAPSKIKISFETFQFNENVSCDVDYIEIFEGTSKNALSVGRYCSSKRPTSYISNGNSLTIVFKSDLDSKFKIKYERACTETFTNESGVFSPSAFYDRYGVICTYIIERPPGSIINLNLETDTYSDNFWLYPQQKCLRSYVEVRDGDHENATVLGKYCDKASHAIVSSQNSLLIKLKLGSMFGIKDITYAFKASYTSVNTGCGGIIRSKFGHITSPVLTEGTYPSELYCKWIIIAPPDNLITLSWPVFNIEQSYDCSYDYVKIFDNNTDFGTGAEVGKYCGATLIPTSTSTSNIVTILFYSDSSVNEGSFLASYSFRDERDACNINFIAPAGVIKSPRYPNEYSSDQKCTYQITVPAGQQILLNFTDFDLEYDPECRFDYLEIRNGGSISSPLLDKYCGKQIPKQIWSHTNKIFLNFHSDISHGGRGFLINWSSTSTGCGGTLTSPSGSIVSPNYPEPYDKNTECFWKIIISQGSLISVVFADIDLEPHPGCIADYVDIYDGLALNSKKLGRFCTESNSTIVSTSNKMMIKFRSDINFQGRGFKINYRTDCHNKIKGFRGVIESPNFPYNYIRGQDCLWEIEVPRKNKINITFSHFTMDGSNSNCSTDYLEIEYADPQETFFTEDSLTYRKYGRYCVTHNSPGHIGIDAENVRIHFVTDHILSIAGFRLEWENSGCGGHIHKKSGTISSPNYPNAYPKDIVCEWLIEVDYGNSVSIEFSNIDIEVTDNCEFDFVKLYNGNNDGYPLLANLCSQKKKSLVTSTGNFMFIRFKADYSLQRHGFIANFSSVPTTCGGHLSSEDGSVFSPNYPQNYNRNETCEWLIEVSDGDSIELTFEDVDLYTSENCSRNYVKVFDGPSQAYPVLSTVCGNEKPNATIRSTYNHLYIEFMSHTFITTKGFLAKYKKACGSRITTQGSGIIEIDATQYTTCRWSIVSVDPSKHVTLTITHLHGMDYCEYYAEENEPIKIYNGESTEAPLVGSYCGSKIPKTITSGGNALTILVSESFQLAFTATYAVYDNHCGGTLIAEEGYFATPGYPEKYPSDVQCEWILSVSPGNHLTVSFNEFSLPESANCTTDYLEIRSVNSTGRVLGYYCGETPPDNLTHTGDLWLLFRSSKLQQGDDPVQAKGFLAEFNLNKYSELTGSTGQIYSPLYPKSFLNYDTFSYKIIVPVRRKVVLSFKEFDLASEGDAEMECDYLYIEVYDGVDNTAPLLGKYCGLTAPAPVEASSHIMFIEVSYIIAKLSKFILEWNAVSDSTSTTSKTKTKPECGSSETIDLFGQGTKTITSPGYPNGYAANLKCEWTFSTVPMNHIEIQFNKMNFGSDSMVFGVKCFFSDYVTISQKASITNEWTVIRDKLCTMEDVADSIIGTDLVKLKFISNGNINGTGFEALVYENCGGYMTDPTGYILVENITEKLSVKECQWNITVTSTRQIRIHFEHINIPENFEYGCDSYLMIRNGKFPDSPYLGKGKYCGTKVPEDLVSSGSNLFLRFSLHGVGGFRLKYQEIKPSCGANIIIYPFNNSYAEITSPNYPNIPQPHIECEWTIHAPTGERLRVDFEERFDLTRSRSCDEEYVEIRDGGTEFSPLIGRYCDTAPSTQYSTDNIVYIKFFTDTDEPKNGFKAKISLGSCGGTVRGYSGGIVHPKLLNGGQKQNCTWYIIGPENHYLEINLTVSKINCRDHSLIVYEEYLDSPSSNVSEIQDFCSQNKTDFITTGNKAIVKYVGTNTGSFSLRYESSRTRCGSTIEAQSGEIKSPGYPLMNHMHRMCLWTIIAPRGRRITVEFLDLDLSETADIFDQHISVMDNIISIPIKIFGGKSKPEIVKSSSNKLWIYYENRFPSNHRGFKLKFTSDEPTICVGDFNRTSGSFESPRIGNKSYVCNWIHQKSNPTSKETLAIQLSVTGKKPVCEFREGIYVTDVDFRRALGHYCAATEQPVIVRSPLEITELWIFQKPNRLRNVSVSYEIHPCGGIVTDQMGYLESPKIQPTSKSFECAWLIKVTEGEKINLTVIDADLGQDCSKSFLSVYNGYRPSSPLIQKYCGDNKPQNSIVSQTTSLWVEYRWEKGSTGKEIKIKYEPYGSACGGIFLSSHGLLETPKVGNDYPENSECLWDLSATDGYTISVKFVDRFYLEESKNCQNDFLEFFDYVDDNWVSLGKKCGRNTPDDIQSTSNKLRVLFRSNDKISGSGFRAVWNWTCGGTFIATQTPHYIVSPGYPEAYSNLMNCIYIIKPINTKNIVSIKFMHFDLEEDATCSYDNVTLNINGANDKAYCGKDKPPEYTKAGPVTITFKTDFYLTKTGFKFMYVDETCGGNITKEGPIYHREISRTSTVPSVYYLNCVWRITAPPGMIVVLDIIKLGLNTRYCAYKSFSVYRSLTEHNSDRLAKLCGNIENQVIQSNTSTMLIKLDAFPTNFHGFQAEIRFTYGPAAGCGGNINVDQTKYITAPALENVDCLWTLTAPKDTKVAIKFNELNLPQTCSKKNRSLTSCQCSFLKIKDGLGPFGETIETICSNSSFSHDTRIFTSTWNTASIQFFAHGRSNNLFKIELNPKLSACGHSLYNVTAVPQIMESPNYPGPYPANIKCSYVFKSTETSSIRLRFLDLDLTNERLPKETRHECTGDTITVAADLNNNFINTDLGPTTVYSRGINQMMSFTGSFDTHIFCGTEENQFDVYSPNKVVSVTLNSLSNGSQGKGFKIEYSLTGCSRNYSEPSGRILVDQGKENQCSIYVEVPSGRTISLYFLKFFVGFADANCTRNALEIREEHPTGKLLRKVCGFRLPSPIFSNTNKLYIHVNTTNLSRFEITYISTREGSGCGGEIFDSKGKLYSPMYPEPFRNDTRCTWMIRGPPGMDIVVKFIVFNIQGSCDQTFVDVTTYTGIVANSKRLCKDDEAGLFRSQSSVQIVYSSSRHNGGAGWIAYFKSVLRGSKTEDVSYSLGMYRLE